MTVSSRRVISGVVLTLLTTLASACGTDEATIDTQLPSTVIPAAVTTAAVTTAVVTTAGTERLRVIVDTDLAGDDIVALAYLTTDPRVDLLAVSISGTGEVRCPRGAEVASAILDLLGHSGVPVACGTSEPFSGDRAFPAEWRDAADNAWGLALPPIDVSELGLDAVALLIEQIESSPSPITVLTLGPLTNIALVLTERPDLAANIERVVVMGGAVDVPGNVQPRDGAQPSNAEWNFYVDPSAAAVVLTSGAPLTLVTLDATNLVPVTDSARSQLAANDVTAATAVVRHLFESYPPPYLWDPLAAIAVTDADLLPTQDADIIVVTDGDDAGRTVRSDDGTAVALLTKPTDPESIVVHLVQQLSGHTGDEVVTPTTATGVDVAVANELLLGFDGETCVYEGPSAVQQGFYSVALQPGPTQFWGVVMHFVPPATMDEAMAWIADHPDEPPPMVDSILQVGEGVLESPGIVEFLPEIIGVACLSSDGSIHAGASVAVSP